MSKKLGRAPASSPQPQSKFPIEIDGKTYNLCFDSGPLVDAEEFFGQRGHEVNLLKALTDLTIANVRRVFPCAVHTFHPELSFEDAQALMTLPAIYPVAIAINAAWAAQASNGAAADAPAAEAGAVQPPAE